MENGQTNEKPWKIVNSGLIAAKCLLSPLNLQYFLSNLLVLEIKDIDFVRRKTPNNRYQGNEIANLKFKWRPGKIQRPLYTTFGAYNRELL